MASVVLRGMRGLAGALACCVAMGCGSDSGTGGGSGGSQGGAGGTATGGGGTAGCSTIEDCGNGVDDDCNGYVDCADPACGAYACVAAPPPGWTGPVEVQSAVGSSASLSQCDDRHAKLVMDAHADLVAEPAACSPCGCGAPTGVKCEAELYTSVPNQGTSCSKEAALLVSGTCAEAPLKGAAYWSIVQALSFGGECAPTGGELTSAAPEWQQTMRACAAEQAGAGCPESRVCAPKGESPFEPSLCVLHDGEVDCPATDYVSKRVFFASVKDERGCSACECQVPQPVPCQDVTLTFYDSAGCTGTSAKFNGQQPCSYGYNMIQASALLDGSATTSCNAKFGGGTPTGTATPSGAVTVCCM